MSMYEAFFGKNSEANILLAILGIDQPGGKWSSGRFRDISLNADGTRILLYTRNGASNRECWSDVTDAYKSEDGVCHCPGCVISSELPRHPNYVTDYDDTFDHTYATIEFSVPADYAEVCAAMSTGEDPPSIGERFLALFEQMGIVVNDK